MKIIDKNTDYYDYWQNILRDDTFKFDRRDSYVLSKEEFANAIHYDNKNKFLLLQVCHKFWLLGVSKKDIPGSIWKNDKTEVVLSLVVSWENYESKRELIKLSYIRIGYNANLKNVGHNSLIVSDINSNNFVTIRVFNDFTVFRDYKNGFKRESKTIPILKNIGIPALVDAKDVYLALEEYFSEEKSAGERTDPIGVTDEDKVVAHGFDVKASFRRSKKGRKANG